MAKNAYIGVDGVARKIKKGYIGVDSVARKVKNGYIGVDGVARQFFVLGTPLSSLAVGTSVYLNVSGTRTEFMVVQQGLPSSSYDSSCDGTWVLRKYAYSPMKMGQGTYSGSNVDKYITGTFFNQLDTDIRGILITAKLPFMNGILERNAFALSSTEYGSNQNDKYYIDGSRLSYFSSKAKRINYTSDGTAVDTWVRTREISYNAASIMYKDGSHQGLGYGHEAYIRPCVIFPSTTIIDDNFNITAQ